MAKNLEDPERCTLHCKNMQAWQAEPDGYTSTEGGLMKNSEIAARARRICPGVEIYLRGRVEAHDLTVDPDGRATFAAGFVIAACQFFEADHSLGMGS